MALTLIGSLHCIKDAKSDPDNKDQDVENSEDAKDESNLKQNESLKPIRQAIVRYLGRDSWNDVEASLESLVAPEELSGFVGTNLDSKDFVQFLAKLADSTTYNKDENNTFRLRDVKGFLCFEASLMQTKDFLARYPEKNGAFLTLKCIGPDETMETTDRLTKEACRLAQLANLPYATVFNVCIVSEVKTAAAVENVFKEKDVPVTSGFICVQGCRSKDRLSLASSVKTFHVGHFSISGKKLTKHYHFKESEKQDNFITVTSDQGSESLPESGFAWLIHHFSRPNDFVIEIDSKVGKGFCSALKEGRNAFLVNSDTENADSLRHMVGEALTPDILD